jgi:hypothetical protein
MEGEVEDNAFFEEGGVGKGIPFRFDCPYEGFCINKTASIVDFRIELDRETTFGEREGRWIN